MKTGKRYPPTKWRMPSSIFEPMMRMTNNQWPKYLTETQISRPVPCHPVGRREPDPLAALHKRWCSQIHSLRRWKSQDLVLDRRQAGVVLLGEGKSNSSCQVSASTVACGLRGIEVQRLIELLVGRLDVDV